MMFKMIYLFLGYFATGIGIFLIRCYLTIIKKLDQSNDNAVDKDVIVLDFFLSMIFWPFAVVFLIRDFIIDYSKNDNNILLTLYNRLEERYGTKDDNK